ncbi:MAG: nitroreductase [Alphaproteobacteria bacterium]|nr:nitroreductase [Alphaproteobacteria bacterium]
MTDLLAADLTPANPTEAVILSRRAIRGFLPTPVSRADVTHLLDVAARAPSGTNMQPWKILALAGEPLRTFCDDLSAGYLAGGEDNKIDHIYYPSPLFEPYISRRRKIGWDLYGLLGIARGETAKMKAQVVNNLHFFGAPVGMICTIDRRMKIGSWIDYGMFLQNIAIAARARGLDTCPMAVFAEFPGPIRALLGIPEDDVIVCGMAIGHEDTAVAANTLVTGRVPADGFTEFRGF